jgi:hypothetical protein
MMCIILNKTLHNYTFTDWLMLNINFSSILSWHEHIVLLTWTLQLALDMHIIQAQYTMAHRHANTPNTVYNGTYLEESIQKIIAAHYKLVFFCLLAHQNLSILIFCLTFGTEDSFRIEIIFFIYPFHIISFPSFFLRINYHFTG